MREKEYMSTQCFMSRRGKSPGRFIFALLLGALLALPCLLPVAAFARASGGTGDRSFSPSLAIPAVVLNKVGVSVVRLIASYGAGSDQVTCTSLGTLVDSQEPSAASPYHENWVLTDGNLISNSIAECGKAGDTLTLNTIQVWASNAYAQGRTTPLGTLTCTGGVVRCTDGLSSRVLDPLVFSDPTAPAPYILFPFQSTAGGTLC